MNFRIPPKVGSKNSCKLPNDGVYYGLFGNCAMRKGAMTENEAKQVLKSMGWTPTIRKRRRPGTPYLYASRREKSRVIERYIAPISRLTQMTEVDIVAKLQQKRPQDGMRGEH